MHTVSVLCETAGKHVKPLLQGHLGKVLQQGLQDELTVAFYAVRAMTHMIVHVGTDDLNSFQNLIPVVLQVSLKICISY